MLWAPLKTMYTGALSGFSTVVSDVFSTDGNTAAKLAPDVMKLPSLSNATTRLAVLSALSAGILPYLVPITLHTEHLTSFTALKSAPPKLCASAPSVVTVPQTEQVMSVVQSLSSALGVCASAPSVVTALHTEQVISVVQLPSSSLGVCSARAPYFWLHTEQVACSVQVASPSLCASRVLSSTNPQEHSFQ